MTMKMMIVLILAALCAFGQQAQSMPQPATSTTSAPMVPPVQFERQCQPHQDWLAFAEWAKGEVVGLCTSAGDGPGLFTILYAPAVRQIMLGKDQSVITYSTSGTMYAYQPYWPYGPKLEVWDDLMGGGVVESVDIQLNQIIAIIRNPWEGRRKEYYLYNSAQYGRPRYDNSESRMRCGLVAATFPSGNEICVAPRDNGVWYAQRSIAGVNYSGADLLLRGRNPVSVAAYGETFYALLAPEFGTQGSLIALTVDRDGNVAERVLAKDLQVSPVNSEQMIVATHRGVYYLHYVRVNGELVCRLSVHEFVSGQNKMVFTGDAQWYLTALTVMRPGIKVPMPPPPVSSPVPPPNQAP